MNKGTGAKMRAGADLGDNSRQETVRVYNVSQFLVTFSVKYTRQRICCGGRRLCDDVDERGKVMAPYLAVATNRRKQSWPVVAKSGRSRL